MTKEPTHDRESPAAYTLAAGQKNQPKGDFVNPGIEYQEVYNPVRSEMAMWRAVITQALMDAASNSAKPEAKWDKSEARRWLLGNSEDFITVCHYAGYDPDYVHRMVKGALARNCRWRAEAKSGVAQPAPEIFTKSLAFSIAEPRASARLLHVFA